jgi:FkbM family methyltransferase
MTAIPSARTMLRANYTDRTFSLAGSAIDESVFGAIVKANGIWEPHITQAMARLIKPDDICLDIGANIGVYTLIMSDLARRGNVHAFEPSSMNYNFLRQNITDNRISNATPHRLALGNKVGRSDFHYLPQYAGSSFGGHQTANQDPDKIILDTWGTHWPRFTETVECLTLDQWMIQNSIDRLDFIKMDVEGSEHFVIEGSKAVFEKYRPTLITEFNTACLTKYFAVSPASYFELLTTIYPYIYMLRPGDDEIQQMTSYDDLAPLLTVWRWQKYEVKWADLLCTTTPVPAATRRPAE